ncbi:MAG: twin-arginine translocation signal domain-containing protein [Planctomycetota bacterium]
MKDEPKRDALKLSRRDFITTSSAAGMAALLSGGGCTFLAGCCQSPEEDWLPRLDDH